MKIQALFHCSVWRFQIGRIFIAEHGVILEANTGLQHFSNSCPGIC